MQKYKYNCMIDLFEKEFNIKNLTTKEEQEKGYLLRHKIFVNELCWVPPQPDAREIDLYDGKGMVPLGVIDQKERLVAYLRITLPWKTFMMENEFSFLIDEPIRKKSGTIEVSRVCTEFDIRKTIITTDYGRFHIGVMLYKGLYVWCKQNSVDEMYMVIEYKLLRLLRMTGFPCRMIGTPATMSDGVSAVAVRISWREFEQKNKSNRAHLLDWFSDNGKTRKAA